MEKVCLKGESLMSVLNVTNLSHGFGDRAIFENVSFRLLKGEHVGLVGANGEGKSTFMNIQHGHCVTTQLFLHQAPIFP